MVIEFLLMFHRDKPIDWLLDHLLYVKVCNPEKDKVCCIDVDCWCSYARLLLSLRKGLRIVQHYGDKTVYISHYVLPVHNVAILLLFTAAPLQTFNRSYKAAL
jgi:hypothetical protein